MRKHELDIIPEDCELCNLYKSRKNIVWGNGNQYAPLILCGEAPGKTEDEQGLAFVGRSGELITNTLMMFKVPRNYVLILNIVKCRPPNNRNPSLEEILACRPFLRKQIQMSPYITTILALGKIAWFGLTGKDESVSYGRGIPEKRGKYIYMKTYHPAYVLRNNSSRVKKEFMRDIRKALTISGLRKK